jgi:hypothetical protein
MKNAYSVYQKTKINLSNATKIAYGSLYISTYHNKCLCYKLQISCLPKQGLRLNETFYWVNFILCHCFGLKYTVVTSTNIYKD